MMVIFIRLKKHALYFPNVEKFSGNFPTKTSKFSTKFMKAIPESSYQSFASHRKYFNASSEENEMQ